MEQQAQETNKSRVMVFPTTYWIDLMKIRSWKRSDFYMHSLSSKEDFWRTSTYEE